MVLLLCAALFILQTEWAQTYLTQEILTKIEKKTQARIQIGKVNGFLPFHLTASDISIEYENQTFQASHAYFSFSPLLLINEKQLRGEIELHNLSSTIDPRLANLNIQSQINFEPQLKVGTAAIRITDLKTPGSYLSIHAALKDKIHTHFELKDPQGKLLQSFNDNFPAVDYYLSANGSATVLDWFRFITDSNNPFKIDGNIQATATSADLRSAISSKISINSLKELNISQILGEIDLPDEIQPEPLTLSGAVNINLLDKNVDGILTLSPFHLAPLSYLANCPLKGGVSANCRLKGNMDDLSADISIFSNSIEIDTLQFESLLMTSQLNVSHEKVKGMVLANASWNDHPLSIKSNFRWDGKAAKFSQISVDTKWTEFKGDLNLDTTNFLFQGGFNGSVGPLEPIFDIAQIPHLFTANSTSFSVQFNPDHNNLTEQFKFKLNINRLANRTLSIDHLTLEGHLDDLLNDFEGIIKLDAKGLQKGDIKADHLTFSTFVAKNYAMHSFDGSCSNMSDQNWEVHTSGSWRSFPDSAIIVINHISGHVEDHPILLRKPFDIHLEEDRFSLSSVQLMVNKSRLDAYAEIREDLVNASLKTKNLPISILQLFYDFPIESSGEIFAEFHAGGTLDQPVITGDIFIENLSIMHPKAQNLKDLTLNIEGAYRESELNLSGHLSGITEQPVAAHAALPIDLSLLPFHFEIQKDRKIDVNLTAEGEISAIPELLVFESSSVAGYTTIDLDITGTWEDPLVNGMITLKNGSWESLDTGAVIKSIQAEFEASGNKVIARRFTGYDGRNGTVNGSGGILLDSDQLFPYNWSFDMKNVMLVRFDNINASGSGIINLSGNFEHGLLSGNLILDEATFTIPEETSGMVKTVEVSYKNGFPAFKSPILPENQRRWVLDLNINLEVPRYAYIEGRDLFSEWKGALQFTGTSTAPIFNGTLNLMAAEYMFNGRPFESDQGTINFSGESGKKSTLYIIAGMDLDEIRVETILKGSVNDPILSFRSYPPMSQREILSWLLFNHGLGELTPFQGAELTQTAISLGNAKSSSQPDVLSRLRNSIGIDRVDISSSDTDDSNEVSLRVGKYISRGIFVSLSKSINAEANQIGIEAKLINDFKIKAELGDNASAKVNLKWERDY